MRVPYHLLLLVIFSVGFGSWPVSGLAFSVDRSAYDWFLDESDSVSIEILADEGRGSEVVELSLVRLDFSEGTDVPRILPLDENLGAIFAVDKKELSLVKDESLKVTGGELRLEGRGLVLGLVIIGEPDAGGLTAEHGVVVPIFLRGRVQDVNLQLENLGISRFQVGGFKAQIEIRNQGEDTVVPKGKILYKNLLFGERVEVEINPTKRRVPPGVKRQFSVETDLGGGLWRAVLEGANGRQSRIFLVVEPGFLGIAGGVIAILIALVIRHVFKKRRI